MHGKEVYWENEAPVFDEDKLELISESIKLDTVITHSAPSFCELTSKSGLASWSASDETLEADVKRERQVMDNIFKSLKQHNHPLQRWYYGHFHQSWRASIDGVMFKMLDIMEFCEIH